MVTNQNTAPAIGSMNIIDNVRNILTTFKVRGITNKIMYDIGDYIDKNYDLDGFFPTRVMIALGNMIDQGPGVFEKAVKQFDNVSATMFRIDLIAAFVTARYFQILAGMGLVGMDRDFFARAMNRYNNFGRGIYSFKNSVRLNDWSPLDKFHGFRDDHGHFLHDKSSHVLEYLTTVEGLIRGLDYPSMMDHENRISGAPDGSVNGTIAISGRLDGLTRDHAQRILADFGWTLKGNVTPETKFVFTANQGMKSYNSEKVKKALDLYIPVISVRSMDDILFQLTYFLDVNNRGISLMGSNRQKK